MATEKHELSSEQKKLVAVGASVGAGCQPCVSHHLHAGAKAGLEGELLLAAVTTAERVTAEAAVAMADHARAKLGASVTVPAMLSRLGEALASFGAALGANDVTNIERQLRAAAELGASRPQLQQAIETAHTVQENAARIHLREAERLLDALAPALADNNAEPEEGCGCGADDGTEAAVAGAGAACRDERPVGLQRRDGKALRCSRRLCDGRLRRDVRAAHARCRGREYGESAGRNYGGWLMQAGGLTMTTIATIALPVADSWTISVGGGWIVVMLIGMGLCFVFAFMGLMRGGQGWPMCGWRRLQETALTFGEHGFDEGALPLDNSHQGDDVRDRTAVRNSGPGVSSRESGASP